MNPDMMSMMSDTAGFQKILEMSKREEDDRQANFNKITENERLLMEQGLQMSQTLEESKLSSAQ